jgi:hypothetical protein
LTPISKILQCGGYQGNDVISFDEGLEVSVLSQLPDALMNICFLPFFSLFLS